MSNKLTKSQLLEKERKIINFHNAKNIVKDNNAAKEAGLSYGKYKAGLYLVKGGSEYQVSTTEYLRPTAKKEKETKIVRIL